MPTEPGDDGHDPFAVDPGRALDAIHLTWGDVYLAEYTEAGGWIAWRRDGLGGPIAAGTPDELIRGIRDDWDMRPVRVPAPRPTR